MAVIVPDPGENALGGLSSAACGDVNREIGDVME